MSGDNSVNSVIASVSGLVDKPTHKSVEKNIKQIDSVASLEDVSQEVAAQTARIEKVEDVSVEVAELSFSIDRIREMIKELETALPAASNSLKFHVDEVLDRPVITVVDEKSGEIVRTLPSDEILRAVHNIDRMRGILFEQDS